MTQADFDMVLNRRIKKTIDLLSLKGLEYSNQKDRLHNFKRAGEMQRCKPETALLGMLTKHLISIYDAVESIERGNDLPPIAFTDEKIGDAINYLILLEASINEMRVKELK